MIEEEPFYTVDDGFTLYPDPDLIERNRWIVLAEDLSLDAARLAKETEYVLEEDAVVLGAEEPGEPGELKPEELEVEVGEDVASEQESEAEVENGAEAGTEVEVSSAPAVKARELMPLRLRREVSGADAYTLLSGPYKDLGAIQDCDLLKERGYSCLNLSLIHI